MAGAGGADEERLPLCSADDLHHCDIVHLLLELARNWPRPEPVCRRWLTGIGTR